MHFPNSVNILNTYKAYINIKNSKKTLNKHLNCVNLEINPPDTLKVLCVKNIAENWLEYPIYDKIRFADDRNLLLDFLELNNDLPLELLCTHIKDDVFWEKKFKNKWKQITTIRQNYKKSSWIKIYIEKYFAETIEKMQPSDYDGENIVNFIELYSSYVEYLQIKRLQPSLTENMDHIPFNLILSNLVQLRSLDLTYDVKDIGINFYLGCSQITRNDIQHLVSGLETCNELREFRFSSTKLEPYMLKLIGRALEKGCRQIEVIHLRHCRFGDEGLTAFLCNLGVDSFQNLTEISLINNFLSQEGAIELAEALKKLKNVEKLDLCLNPLSFGSASIIGILHLFSIKELNFSCCSIDETIEIMLLNLLKMSKTLTVLNLSTNKLGENLGQKIAKTVSTNKTSLKSFDIRNTEISNKTRTFIDSIILKNKDKTF